MSELPLSSASLAGLESALAGLPEHRRHQFRRRADRWWDDLHAGLAAVYPDPDEVAARALLVAAHAFAERPEDLLDLDERRILRPDWFADPSMIGYATYTEQFADDGTLAGVAARVDHLRALGVRYLHLMPLLQPRPAPNDGGYAVADYRTVRPDLGTTEDLRDLTTALRRHGISVCIDLVLNHVAREHEWAVAARRGEQRYRDYFHVFADRTEPDRFEETLPEVFPDFAPGSFSHDPDLDAWVWTTFNDYQWDLNWANPEVFLELLDVVCFLANLGVEVLRLDAIAFIYKRLGTTCQNQPEVHAITQALRAVARIACPAVIFKAEAIVGPDDLVSYLGSGEHHGKVCDLAYHNSLMVQIWSMLATRDTRLAVHSLARFPAIASSTAWITYLRCHDDIGWAIDDGDAEAVGATGHGHRGFLSDFYAGEFAGSFADGLVFQYNPFTGDRRISGTTASLAGLSPLDDPEEDEAVDLAVRRILLAHAIIMGFGGIPMIWAGDELATLNDPHWADDPAKAADNRWAHRPRVDWTLAAEVTGTDGPATPARRVWAGLTRMAEVRARLPHLAARHESRVVPAPDHGVFAVVQHNPIGAFLAVHNVTERTAFLPADWVRGHGLDSGDLTDRLGVGEIRTDDVLTLGPYQSMWLTAPDDTDRASR